MASQRPRSVLPGKSLAALFAAALALALITFLTYRSLAQRSESAAAMQRMTSARNLLNKVMLGVEAGRNGQRGFLLTHDPAYLGNLATSEATPPDQLAQLDTLLAPYPDAAHKLETFGALVRQQYANVDELVELERNDRHDEA